MKRKDQSKKQPTYDLQECKRLTKMGKIKTPKRVSEHMEAINDNVPYPFTEKVMSNFIQLLTEKDFSKSILYEGNSQWFDVYIKTYEFSYIDPHLDEKSKEYLTLYFKYFIKEDELFVQVVSFHPER